MNHNDGKSKEKKSFAEFMQKTAEVSKKAASNAYEGMKNAAEKIKENNQEKKKRQLSPLFPKDYKSKSFKIPNVIKIVDDAIRREEELCEGAIGWLEMVGNGKDNKTEVLFLYDEAREMSGIQFVPSFNINSIYCVDTFDPSKRRFIKADCIFSKAQEEKVAELENLAYCLGAKRCSIEIVAAETSSNLVKKSVSIKADDASVKEETTRGQQSGQRSSGKSVISFAGHDHPTRPSLKWFSYDETIKNLVDMRCNDPDALKMRTLELSGASSATMSRQTAIAIDCMLKSSKIKATSNMESQASRELSSKLIFEIEF